MKPIVLIGAGGHAKVIIGAADALGRPVEHILDDNPQRHGELVLGVPISGGSASIPKFADTHEFIIAIGDNSIRKKMAEHFDLNWTSLIHPAAWVHGSVRMGRGSVIMAGAIVQPDTVMGDHVILNTGCTVDHDGKIGDFVHVAPGAHLSGNVTLEEGVLLGVGSSVRPGAIVGEWTIVGAGGAVARDLPGHVVAVGVPAEPKDRT